MAHHVGTRGGRRESRKVVPSHNVLSSAACSATGPVVVEVGERPTDRCRCGQSQRVGDFGVGGARRTTAPAAPARERRIRDRDPVATALPGWGRSTWSGDRVCSISQEYTFTEVRPLPRLVEPSVRRCSSLHRRRPYGVYGVKKRSVSCYCGHGSSIEHRSQQLYIRSVHQSVAPHRWGRRQTQAEWADRPRPILRGTAAYPIVPH